MAATEPSDLPPPIWISVANHTCSVLEVMVTIEPHIRKKIWKFVCKMPARIMVDMYNTLHRHGKYGFIHIPNKDHVVFSRQTSPYGEYFAVIVNEIRNIIGKPSWFSDKKDYTRFVVQHLHRIYEGELREITRHEAARLYETLTSTYKYTISVPHEPQPVISLPPISYDDDDTESYRGEFHSNEESYSSSLFDDYDDDEEDGDAAMNSSRGTKVPP